jgi:hypothetical protein
LLPRDDVSGFASHDVSADELAVVRVGFLLSVSSATRTSSFSFVKGACFGIIVDALLDEEDDVAEVILAFMAMH